MRSDAKTIITMAGLALPIHVLATPHLDEERVESDGFRRALPILRVCESLLANLCGELCDL
jgi:hypothetical protein